LIEEKKKEEVFLHSSFMRQSVFSKLVDTYFCFSIVISTDTGIHKKHVLQKIRS